MTTPHENLPALEGCPFCGLHLIGDGFYEHPKADCIFSGWEFPELDLVAWNRRAAIAAQGGQDRRIEELEALVALRTAEYEEANKDRLDFAARLAVQGGQQAVSPEWHSVTRAGQVKVGDKLRFKIGDKEYSQKAKLILRPGTDKEEVIYDKGRNFYFITSMVISGGSNHKQVEVLTRIVEAQPVPSKSKRALQELVDQAQDLDMGYGKPAASDAKGEPVRFDTLGLDGRMRFSIGTQTFALDYIPDSDEEFDFMRDMLMKAIARAVLPRDAELRAKYDELIYAVGMKHPNETRHQTALKYIRRAEMPSTDEAKQATIDRSQP